MKLGAYDYISKPFAPLDELRLFPRRMADKVRLEEENQYLRERSETETAVHGIIGSSAGIEHVLRMISRLKTRHTGADLRRAAPAKKSWPALHDRGTLASRPFVAVDCGSLVRNSDRERTVRLREGRVHRSAPFQAGPAAIG